MKKTKFVFIDIEVRHGEYEFNSKSVHEISARRSTEKFGQDYAKQFYSGKPFQYNDKIDKDDWWYFNGGEVAARIQDAREVTKEEYDVLRKFL